MSFDVIQGGKGERTVVCPWCGQTFLDRDELDEHWLSDPRCKANAMTNNPTQSKYEAPLEEDLPSPLRLIKRGDL